jgi:hypothetical protein
MKLKDKSLIICLLILTCQLLNAQQFTHEFGKYSSEEFQMKKYDKDTSAEAVVIYDIGESYFADNDNGFDVVFQRKTKIKIFNKAGLRWAQFEIPYYIGNGGTERIHDLKGNTYNFENGALRKTPLNTSNVYEEKKDEHWVYKKFAMPDVKEGSVIEISYLISSPYVFNFRNWEFQYKIPVIYSEYTTKMVPFYDYSYILQGAKKFDSFKSYTDPGLSHQFGPTTYQEMDYEFIMRDVPAFKDEGFITSMNDYILKLDFQLSGIHRPNGSSEKIMTTWPKMIEELLDHDNFGKYLKTCLKSGKTIKDTMALRTEKEKVQIINRYIKNNFNWNGKESLFASKSLKEFLKTKTGNCSDINLYLTGLLNAVGVEAFPVIISTRDNGKVWVDYPFLHYFNYVITVAKVDDKLSLLDATEPLCQYNEIPTRCLNDVGLIINKAKTDWVGFNGTIPSIISDNIDIKLDAKADTAIASFNIGTSGYDALTFRKMWLGKDENHLKADLFIHDLTLEDSIKVDNLNQIDKPFEMNLKATINTEKVDDKVLVSPFCGAVISENPFKQLFRTYAIDMVYKKRKEYVAMLHIPEGYKILSKPENLSLKNSLVEIQYNTEQINSNTLKVVGYYEFKKEIYDPSDYGYLKFFYSKVIDKFNDKVVLVKN